MTVSIDLSIAVEYLRNSKSSVIQQPLSPPSAGQNVQHKKFAQFLLLLAARYSTANYWKTEVHFSKQKLDFEV